MFALRSQLSSPRLFAALSAQYRHFWTSKLIFEQQRLTPAEVKTTDFRPLMLDRQGSSLVRHVQAWITDFTSNSKLGMAQLDASVFAAPIRNDIMHRVVVWYRALMRGIVQAHGKNRAEVSGSGRKVRPQKGMGRARLGDIRSPLIKGGGRAFPVKTRDFRIKLNVKIRDFGMRSALSSKYAQGQLILIDNLQLNSGGDVSKADSPQEWSNDTLMDVMQKHGWYDDMGSKSLFFYNASSDAQCDSFSAACQSVPRISATDWNEASVYEILNHDYVFITKEALHAIEARYRTY